MYNKVVKQELFVTAIQMTQHYNVWYTIGHGKYVWHSNGVQYLGSRYYVLTVPHPFVRCQRSRDMGKD